ncbi:MAG: hypothetical protein NZ954_02850 [Thermofilaceae archaeon]|nr:hypothetical protein [Thermofilaceae archaeon]MDW8004477.1 hypothetical protein [Thermofilaceae archaeon]
MSLEPLLPSEVENRRAIQTKLDELNVIWRNYVDHARALMDEWEKVKVKLLEKISRTESLLSSVNEELEKLNLEIVLGLANEDEKKDEKSKLEERKSLLEARLKALQEFLESIEGQVLEHGERLKDI